MRNNQISFKESKNTPDSWCPLPWSHISVKGNGVYRLCCHSNTGQNRGALKDTEGNPLRIQTAEWKDVINSDTMKSVRKNMLTGQWSPECQRCQKEFSSGIKPRNFKERSLLTNILGSEMYPSYQKTKALTQADGSISLNDFPISFPDIRFGNLCNLRCAMCSPTDSSAWYQEHYEIFGHYFEDCEENIKLIQKPNGKITTEKNIFNWSKNPRIWSQIEKYLYQFRRIYIAGGEPLLIKDYYKLMKKCIESSVAKQMTIEFNTNITHIPKQAWALWKEFKSIHIGISLDGCEEVNNFIRYPSQWNHIEKNLSLLDKTEENIFCHITPSINVLNIWHLPKFIEYIMKKNYQKIGLEQAPVINPHPVHRPHFLNINILEESFKEKLKKYFDFYKGKFSGFDWQFNYNDSSRTSWNNKIINSCKILDDYIEFMYQAPYQKEELNEWRSYFIYFMDKLDELRGYCWKKIFPELYESTLKWRKLNKPEKWI